MKIDREKYLGNDFKHMAYSDIHIRVYSQRYFISPFSLAKILDKALINSKDVVLLVGSGSGYESAIVSKIASAVIALEEKNFEVDYKKFSVPDSDIASFLGYLIVHRKLKNKI